MSQAAHDRHLLSLFGHTLTTVLDNNRQSAFVYTYHRVHAAVGDSQFWGLIRDASNPIFAALGATISIK